MQGTNKPCFLDAEIPPVEICSASNPFLARQFDAKSNRPKPHKSRDHPGP